MGVTEADRDSPGAADKLDLTLFLIRLQLCFDGMVSRQMLVVSDHI